MNHSPIQPLSAEERELAGLIGKLRVRDEPSPALDQKILRSAREAVAPASPHAASKRRTRWPAITGLAASVLFAAGIAWQLRPYEATPVTDEAVFDAAAGVEVVADSAPMPADATPAEAPSIAVAPESAPDTFGSESPPPPQKSIAPPPVSPVAAPAPVAPAPRLKRANAQAAESAAPPAPMPAAAPPPPAPPAPPPPALAAESVAPPTAFPSTVEDAKAIDAQRTQAERNVSQQRAARAMSAASTARSKEASTASPAPIAGVIATEQYASDAITVTGSRLALKDVPVSDDTALSRSDWLQRIRTRKLDGDQQGARDSLLLFANKYPHAVIPKDLRELSQE